MACGHANATGLVDRGGFMKTRWITPITLAALMYPLQAQNLERKADMVAGGDPNQGKCTVEVVVDGGAEIQVRGNTASMRDLGGQPPQWRRFQCTAAMPANPASFRYVPGDGRGKQELTQEPRNGGAAVVHIQDSQGGAAAYTFDLIWGDQGGGQSFPGTQGRDYNNSQQQRRDQVQGGRDYNNGQPGRDYNNGQPGRDYNNGQPGRDYNNGQSGRDYNNGQPGRDYNNGQRGGDDQQRRGPDYNSRQDPGAFEGRGYDGRPGARMSMEQATRTCQDSIRQEAVQRFGNVEITFRQIVSDNARGADWLTGTVIVRRPWYNRNESYRFSCSVDYESGRLRTAHIGVPN
jgi:hypothetical protein